MIVFLDSNILGLINSRRTSPEAIACDRWFLDTFRKANLVSSELCLYEVRRGLLKASLQVDKLVPGLQGLQELEEDSLVEFLVADRQVLNIAANLWAKAAASGQTSRSDKDIDIDIIIAAHYQILVDEYPGRQVIVATKNLKHLSRFCTAANWQDI
jgi:predicted nucleic acid-binding protein